MAAQRTLSAEMDEATRSLHERLMYHPFEKAISSGNYHRDDYVQYLSDFFAVFDAIERRVLAWPAGNAGVWDPRLARASLVLKDLAFFSASPASPPPTQAALEYATYINTLPEAQLHRLIAHVWTQYGKEMAGGQYFKKNVERRAADLSGNAAHGTGALLYEFDIPQLRQWRNGWRAAMDAIPLSEAERKEVINECVATFLRTEALLPTHARV